MANYCFDKEGNVCMPNVARLHKFLSNPDNFKGEPYSNLPLFQHMRSQALCVMDRLMNSPQFAKVLNDSNKAGLGRNGQAVQEIMSKGQNLPMPPSKLIFASLLSPHLQMALPTSHIDSWMNNLTTNRPEQLAAMYANVLTSGTCFTPRGCLIHTPTLINGHAAVGFNGGGEGAEAVFREVSGSNTDAAEARRNAWKNDGITYDTSRGRELGLPVRNLGDLCFAGILQWTLGDARVSSDSDYGAARILCRPPGGAVYDNSSITTILNGEPNIPDLIQKLKGSAQMQGKSGANCMRVEVWHDGNKVVANINITDLNALNLEKMEPGLMYPIGNLNCANSGGLDILRLVIRKNDDGSYQLGKAESATNQKQRWFVPMKDIAWCGAYAQDAPPPPPRQAYPQQQHAPATPVAGGRPQQVAPVAGGKQKRAAPTARGWQQIAVPLVVAGGWQPVMLSPWPQPSAYPPPQPGYGPQLSAYPPPQPGAGYSSPPDINPYASPPDTANQNNPQLGHNPYSFA
jgi:hypothetical protein